MKTLRGSMAVFALGALGLPLTSAPVFAQETAEELYQSGLYQEEVQGNLERAIELYEGIVEDFPSSRSVAANALMHIGLCHEKLGSREAQRAYERLVRDYADQISVADRARVRLASLQGLARAEAPVETASSGGIVVRHLFGRTPGEAPDVSGEPSPDGRYLAAVDWGTTASNIAVLDLVSGESRQLTDHPGYEEGMALSAGFSPDGNTIAYWWFNADESAEARLAFRDGSPPRTLRSDPGYIYWPGPWRKDGRSLVVGRKSDDGPVEMGWVSLEEGGFQVFGTVPESKPRPGRLSLSPDERYLAFDFGVAEDSDRRDISMIPTDGGAEITVVEHPANDRVVGWVPGTNEFLFISDRGGKSDLYAVEVADGAVRGNPLIVRRDVGQMAPMGFTQDGDLFYWIYTLRGFINVAPFDPETGSVDAEAAQPLLSPKARPNWSPDGRYLTYWHKKDWPTGASDWDQVLGVTDLETGEERELAAHLEVEDPRWSRDGSSILALALETDWRESGDSPGFFSIDPLTGESSELLRFPSQPNWYWELGAALAPNGRDIVYVREGRLVLHDVTSGEETEVYRNPGLTTDLLESSPDGRGLLFAVQDSTSPGVQGPVDLRHTRWRLMVARLPGGEVEELLAVDLDQETRIRAAHWGPDGRYVYFTERTGDEGTAVLKRVSIGGGDAEVVWVSQEPVREFTISPVGDRVAFTTWENKGDTYVMQNLRAALMAMRDNR